MVWCSNGGISTLKLGVYECAELGIPRAEDVASWLSLLLNKCYHIEHVVTQ